MDNVRAVRHSSISRAERHLPDHLEPALDDIDPEHFPILAHHWPGFPPPKADPRWGDALSGQETVAAVSELGRLGYLTIADSANDEAGNITIRYRPTDSTDFWRRRMARTMGGSPT